MKTIIFWTGHVKAEFEAQSTKLAARVLSNLDFYSDHITV